jgi:hypothetical protein
MVKQYSRYTHVEYSSSTLSYQNIIILGDREFLVL